MYLLHLSMSTCSSQKTVSSRPSTVAPLMRVLLPFTDKFHLQIGCPFDCVNHFDPLTLSNVNELSGPSSGAQLQQHNGKQLLFTVVCGCSHVPHNPLTDPGGRRRYEPPSIRIILFLPC